MSPLQRLFKKLQCCLQEVTARVLTPQLNSIYKDNANERNGKTGKRSFTGLDTAEPKLVLYKDNANERNESLLLVARVQLVLYKVK